MTIFLVLLFLAVIALLSASRKTPALRIPAVAVALLTAGLAVFHLLTFAPESGQPLDVPPEEALGYVLASRVQQDFPDGGKVLVFAPLTDEERLLKITTARMDGIQRAIGESHEVIMRGPQARYGNLDDTEAWTRITLGFPLKSFQEWAAKDQDAVAAISLLGMPGGNIRNNGTGLPPLYVAGLSGIDRDRKNLPRGIATVVTYRNDRDFDARRAKELQEIFDQTFVAYPPRDPGVSNADPQN